MILNLLDLYCGAGGAAMGYHRALNELQIPHSIVGVDIVHQPNYPFYFHQEDAIQFLDRVGDKYDFFHASPPCQQHSRCRSLHKKEYPDYIHITREKLKAYNRPYIIENVPGAPLIQPVVLDGIMFDLRVVRRRLFESNQSIPLPGKGVKKGTVGGKNFTRKNPGYYYIVGGHQSGTVQEWRDAMDITWMNKKELAQAIPPAYTQWIGQSVFAQLYKK